MPEKKKVKKINPRKMARTKRKKRVRKKEKTPPVLIGLFLLNTKPNFYYVIFFFFLFKQIQLLPVWIVKKILSYLDKKTLDTCKKVNEYWKYVIADYLKEIATRAQLNKEIEAIEVQITKKKRNISNIIFF